MRNLLAAILLVTAGTTQAAYTIVVSQVGPNVVATGSGTLNLTGLVFGGVGVAAPRVQPNNSALIIGVTAAAQAFDGIAGPAAMGAGGSTSASSSTGDKVGIAKTVNRLIVPNPYVSGAPLSSTATWNATTIAGLGWTPGTYIYTWAGDSLTIIVGAAAVPVVQTPVPAMGAPGLLLLALLVGVGGAVILRRR